MVLGSGKPGWYRRQSVRAKALMGVGTALGVLGMGMLTAGPALADPGNTYIGGGSDTTQSIMDAFATTTGGLVASYDAVDPVNGAVHDMVNAYQNSGTTETLQSFLRPNGSGDGLTALRYSHATNLAALSPYGGGTSAQMPAAGSLAFARSSSGPGSNQSNTGQYVYIPFAYDDVAVSTGPSTLITNASDFTFTDLSNMYKSCSQVTENGVTYWPFQPGVTQPGGTTRIDLYIPQAGSGSRNFWLSTLTGSTTPAACVFDTEQQGPNVGHSLEENHGQIDTDDPNAIFPFSVGQWLYQQAHAGSSIDVRAGAVLNAINTATTPPGGTSISPFGNPPTDTTMNTTTFPIFRELYNVFITSQVTGASADPNLVRMFVGTTSALCQASGIIRSFGFVSLASSTQAPDPCGSTASSLMAFANG
jgi:hypothetical protein